MLCPSRRRFASRSCCLSSIPNTPHPAIGPASDESDDYRFGAAALVLMQEGVQSQFHRSVTPAAVGLAAVLLLWEAVSRGLSIPAYLLPPPSAIVSAGARELSMLLLASMITAR